MATTALGGNAVHTVGELPGIGDPAPNFSLVGLDFGEVTLPEGTRTILNIFPSVDTGVCSAAIRKFNELAAGFEDTTVICVSNDVPMAQSGSAGRRASRTSRSPRRSGPASATTTASGWSTASGRTCWPAPSSSSTPTARSPTPSWCRRSPRSPTTTTWSPRSVDCRSSSSARPERPDDVHRARGAQRRALLEVGLSGLHLMARRQRPVGPDHPPPRHRAAVSRHHRADLPRAAADRVGDRAVRRHPATRDLLDVLQHPFGVLLRVKPRQPAPPPEVRPPPRPRWRRRR